jgi:hypothetical protein
MGRSAWLLLAALWVGPTPIPVVHPTPFPLTSHSDNAARGTALEVGQGHCDGRPIILVRFVLDGRKWLFVYTDGEPTRYLFIEYAVGRDLPLRVWIGQGTEDRITPDRHVENPAEAFPAGPCRVLYPADA